MLSLSIFLNVHSISALYNVRRRPTTCIQAPEISSVKSVGKSQIFHYIIIYDIIIVKYRKFTKVHYRETSPVTFIRYIQFIRKWFWTYFYQGNTLIPLVDVYKIWFLSIGSALIFGSYISITDRQNCDSVRKLTSVTYINLIFECSAHFDYYFR